MTSQLDPSETQRLAQAITDARSERTTKADDLDRFRVLLLKERKSGAPVRALREGLARIGIEISDESLRLWLKAQGDPKQRKAAPSSKATSAPTSPVPRKTAPAMPASVPTPPPAVRGPGPRVARDDI
jgi:hypothetical protein